MITHGLNKTKGDNTTATCFLCGQELPVENSRPLVHKIIGDNGKITPVLAFLCGSCDTRMRQQ